MAHGHKLEIAASAGAIYLGAYRTARSLVSLILIAILAISFVEIVYFRSIHIFTGKVESGGSAVPMIATLIAHSAAMVLINSLLALAVLRFDLHDERPGRDTFPGPSARILGFLLPAFVLGALYAVPILVQSLHMASIFGQYGFPVDIVLPASILCLAGAALLLMVFLPLFAAIAVDSPGASLASAIQDTKRYIWRIFVIWFLVSIPAWGIATFVSEALPVDLVGMGRYVIAVAYAVSIVFWSIVMACTAAHIYREIGDRLAGGIAKAPSGSKQL